MSVIKSDEKRMPPFLNALGRNKIPLAMNLDSGKKKKKRSVK